MPRLDIASKISVKQSLGPKSVTTAENGAAVDTAGFGSVAFVLNVATQAGTSSTFSFEHSDATGSGWAAVDAVELDGAQPGAITTANDVAVYKAGYLGIKRYVRIALTAATAGNLPTDGVIVLSNPLHGPAA